MENNDSIGNINEGSANHRLQPTPVNRSLAIQPGGFTSLLDALDYAARGESGFNFYNQRGELESVLSYSGLRDQARVLATRLLGLGCKKGERVGIVAETNPMFHRFFFACLYAGLVPVALPAGVQLGARKAYVNQIARMLKSCGATVAVAGNSHAAFLEEATTDLDIIFSGTPDDFDALPVSDAELDTPLAGDIAYLQYTSGSTRFPRGVEINHETVLNNAREIAEHGLNMTNEDRFVSWLPYYHDMGLIGFILLPLVTQSSVDYLSPQTFRHAAEALVKTDFGQPGYDLLQSDIWIRIVRASFTAR